MTDLALPPDLAPAPTTLFASDDPEVVVRRATRIAETIAPLIRQQNLVKRIGQSEHVYVEAWALAGSMLGVFATTVRTWEIGDDQGYGATVEACTLAGNVVGRADAVVMRDEEVGGKRKWLEAPAFQLISMAQTRGSSKALRMPLGFVMKLAGYETTPAEEMEAAAARGETVTGGVGVRPGWRDIGEQQRAHAAIGQLVDQAGLREWVAEYLESKAYTRPLAKAQLNQLRKAIDREIEERSGSAVGDDGPPERAAGPDPTAGAGSSRPTGMPGDAVLPGSPAPDPNAGTGEARPGPHVARPGSTSASARIGQDASPTEADRPRAEVATKGSPAPELPLGSGATPTPPDGPADPPVGRPSGGTTRSRSARRPLAGEAPADREPPEPPGWER